MLFRSCEGSLRFSYVGWRVCSGHSARAAREAAVADDDRPPYLQKEEQDEKLRRP